TDGWGATVFVALALSWPVPVLLNDPNAARVWMLEMGQKAGVAGIAHLHQRLPLAADWPWVTLPWVVIATLAVILPFLKRGREFRPGIWFPWWWSVGNLAMFSFWTVAKPNYYLPCLPGVAILCGIEWVRLTQSARAPAPSGALARRVLQLHWVAFFVAGLIVPALVHQAAPALLLWSVTFAVMAAAGVVASAWAWHRGATAGSLVPLIGAMAIGVLI